MYHINVEMRKLGATMLASCNVVAFQHQGTHKNSGNILEVVTTLRQATCELLNIAGC